MKGLRNATWPMKTRPSLLACVLAMRQERRAYETDTVMAAYEQAVALLEAEHTKEYVPPAPAPPVENVRPLVIASIDNVEDDEDRDADDPVEVTYGASVPQRIAGMETEGEADDLEVALEASEVTDEDSEEVGSCAA